MLTIGLSVGVVSLIIGMAIEICNQKGMFNE